MQTNDHTFFPRHKNRLSMPPGYLYDPFIVDPPSNHYHQLQHLRDRRQRQINNSMPNVVFDGNIYGSSRHARHLSPSFIGVQAIEDNMEFYDNPDDYPIYDQAQTQTEYLLPVFDDEPPNQLEEELVDQFDVTEVREDNNHFLRKPQQAKQSQNEVGLYGWRKKFVYLLVVIIVLLVGINLALVVWIISFLGLASVCSCRFQQVSKMFNFDRMV